MTIHYDELWKNIIEKMFPHFLAFYLPALSADTDLAAGYEFLDKELQRIKLKGKKGKKFVDKLVKVRLRNGLEKWLLIHVEVQGKHEVDFAQRMFQYFYRIHDKYEIDITALAILTYDKTAANNTFHYDVYGTTLTYQYNVARIDDYPEPELVDSTNPFALITLAVQYANQYRDDEEWKFKVKRRLIKMLRDKAYCREEIVELFEFIDDILSLTDTMKNVTVHLNSCNTPGVHPRCEWQLKNLSSPNAFIGDLVFLSLQTISPIGAFGDDRWVNEKRWIVTEK